MRNFIFCFCVAAAVSASGAEIKINFEDFAQGQSPTNFHSALAGGGKPGEWSVVMDDVPSAFAALSGQTPIFNRHAVLAQTSDDATDERFPMLIYDGETFKDFKLATQFKIIGGVTEQMAGIVFRFQNESNFYVVRASALGHNLRFYKMVDGVRSDPLGPQVDISTNTWHTLAVQCQGTQIIVWLDDRLVMPPLNDNTFAAGKIGFWTKSDAVSHFGDTVIDYTPLIPAAQTLVDNIMKELPRILGLRICAPDENGRPRVIASKDGKETGQSGNDSEKDAAATGAIYFGREKGGVVVTMPLCDRNGEPIASVRVRLKSEFLGESQDAALTRVRVIVQEMQAQVTSRQDLMQ
jgi:3-keto-disaccharide hydrolase